jgi:hypothetical protein
VLALELVNGRGATSGAGAAGSKLGISGRGGAVPAKMAPTEARNAGMSKLGSVLRPWGNA